MGEYDPEKTDENGDRLRVVVDRLKAENKALRTEHAEVKASTEKAWAENAALRSRVEALEKAGRELILQIDLREKYAVVTKSAIDDFRAVLGGKP